MKKILFVLAVIIIASCKNTGSKPNNDTGPGADPGGNAPTEQDLKGFLDKTVARQGEADGNAGVTYTLNNFKVGVTRKWTDMDGGHPANGRATTSWLVYATYVATTHYHWKTSMEEQQIIYDAFKEDTGNWYFAKSDEADQHQRSWDGPTDIK